MFLVFSNLFQKLRVWKPTVVRDSTDIFPQIIEQIISKQKARQFNEARQKWPSCLFAIKKMGKKKKKKIRQTV